MGYRDLLGTDTEMLISPWIGGRSLYSGGRQWKIVGSLPSESGWFRFQLQGRSAKLQGGAEPAPETLEHMQAGYLVGEHLVSDHVQVHADSRRISDVAEAVHLLEPGLERFARVSAGRTHAQGRLVFVQEEFPLGPEEQVMSAFLDESTSLDGIAGVVPALDGAFRVETWRRQQVARRRAAVQAALQRQEEERQLEALIRLEEAQEEADREAAAAWIAQFRTPGARSERAAYDFESAARAALSLGGASYLDHRAASQRGEMVVRFAIQRDRFECTCDAHTLRIIDAGVCLTDDETGERGDTRFTLESLPGVIRQAQREGVLVVFRHVQ